MFLTFDDGPNEPFTSQILDILKKYQVKASFFVCGKNIELFPESIKRIVKEGHAIGNHAYSHSPILSRLGLISGEIKKTSEAIYRITGVKTHFFRPPWGFLTPWLRSYLKNNGYRIVLWDIKTRDWNGPSAEIIRDRVLDNVKPGAVVLMHDGFETKRNGDRSKTVKALPQIIEGLKAKGYQLTSIKDLSEEKLSLFEKATG